MFSHFHVLYTFIWVPLKTMKKARKKSLIKKTWTVFKKNTYAEEAEQKDETDADGSLPEFPNLPS